MYMYTTLCTCFDGEGNRSTRKKPMRTLGDNANSTQKDPESNPGDLAMRPQCQPLSHYATKNKKKNKKKLERANRYQTDFIVDTGDTLVPGVNVILLKTQFITNIKTF